ncbi:MAG: MarR family transcriptional regulator [Butyricicoccus sp.]|nr:MarR family transcriptional regulator [Butyricicoccus sp.]MBQ8584793.1 MarR family transcriptional regulator [Butyricicoccus sp.]
MFGLLLNNVYTKFKLHFYQEMFAKLQSRETTLTTIETYCIEIIDALDHPTINEFASFIRISPPNAAYKINSMIKKGYLTKIRSEKDRREYFLEPTQKYYDYYRLSMGYVEEVAERVEQRVSTEDLEAVARVMRIMSEELMPEVQIVRDPLDED